MPRLRSPFGKTAATLRIEHDLLLKNFAEMLGVSASRLSNVEFGERPVPEGWFEIIRDRLKLDLADQTKLKKAILRSRKTFHISAETDEQREVLVAFIENQEKIDPGLSRRIVEMVTTEANASETVKECKGVEIEQ